jgi:HD-GYP domain-containing protein (c-di-GMP phosphodiesterase class II)
MLRYLPLALLTTALVTVLPAMLVATVAPRGSPLLTAASSASAVALSIAIATAAAAVWKRHPRSRDILFADLLLWGWARRRWTEWRLSRVHELYESARSAGPGVSIELLTGLGRMLEARDAYTHGHGQRVARHAERIARSMHLSSTEVAKIRAAAAVHDVGKLYTPREILNNPGRLTDEEFELVKRHASDGADMLAGVGDAEIVAMVRHHHERVDGGGYPDGLAGEDIPLGARIIAVADTFDAITSNRAYRGAGTQRKALEVLSRGAGTQLDSAAVASFRHRYTDRRSVAWLAVGTAVTQRLLVALQTASQSFGLNGGISSILPALGTAGLLGFSPGLHARSPATPTHRHPALVPVQPAARAVGSSPHAPAHGIRRTANANHTSPGGGIPRATPLPPTSRAPAASSPRTPAGGAGPRGAQQVTGAPTPSTPAPPAPAPPVTVPPVEAQPPVPVPPITPPVPLPGIPTVTPPPVSVPTVPSVPLPSSETPVKKLPSVG